ncbi:hypothetical protein K435DRAFT_967446 [Dendrothele bispora CBS 962.96]|uniref:DUF6534 domain-containing protein n=1 Tax=Dendrothele bispora (strain CBS 962.96) TaxID=1314807 RepID=A0A4S8LU84_DENBC|nr:hypothetical protein K435DRAFT_967446 [Dendrothele bispora CBS 962.96]
MPAGPPTITELYAPMFVGSVLGTMLYGVLMVQIAYLIIADTANTFFDLAMVYEPLILKWGEQSVLSTSPLFLRADGIVTTLISTPVQMFMGWRIKIIMESWIPFVIISVLAWTSLSGALWLAIEVSKNPHFAAFDDFKGAPIMWLMTSAAADVVIAVCLVYALTRKKSNVSILNDQIDRIIRCTYSKNSLGPALFDSSATEWINSLVSIQTGAITAIGALADAIVFIILPRSSIFFSWDLCLSKLYTNTLLSSLNARNNWRYRNKPPVQNENALFSYSDESTSHNRTLQNEFQMGKIGISTEVHQRSDPEMGGENWSTSSPYATPKGIYGPSSSQMTLSSSVAYSPDVSTPGRKTPSSLNKIYIPQKPQPF